MRAGWNEFVLNGKAQWVSVRGAQGAPVLLFLHGGPGGSEYAQRRRYLRDLERDWLVVDWDQSGAGRSYHGGETCDTLSVESLVADGTALVERLAAEQHGPGQVVLLGHSFGTVLGLRIAQQTPECVGAYVGASQVVNWALQEERSYDWALAEASLRGNDKAESALNGVGRPVGGQYGGGTDAVTIQRRWLGTLGGVAVDPRFVPLWALSIFTSRGYPLGAKLRYLKAMDASMALLWPQLCDTVDFRRDLTTVAVPVHLFAGQQDRITDLAQIQEWFDLLECPAKRLEIVEGAAHLNLYEQPARFVAFMEQVRATLP
jgi:pimeloyl-ACP methyl ester carboxylesterase